MTYPTLREQVRDVLAAAGFASREDTIPGLLSGGTFDLTSGTGVRVRVEWWDSAAEDRRALLGRFGGALRDAGLEAEDRGDGLYVAEPGRSQRREARSPAHPPSGGLPGLL